MRIALEMRNAARVLRAPAGVLGVLQKMQNIIHRHWQLKLVPMAQPVLDDCIGDAIKIMIAHSPRR
jgi:hypothetical protein